MNKYEQQEHYSRWTADDLANKSGLEIATIRRLEVDDWRAIRQTRILEAIQKALEQGGVEFIGTPDNQPGVRLK